MLIRVLTLAEALIFMLPMSILWLLLCYGMVGQPTFNALRQGAFPPPAIGLLGVWLAFCGVGLCALWEFFLRHHKYTLRSIPLRVKVGIVLGFIGAIPLSAKGGLGAVVFLAVPLALLVQFYWLIKRNSTLPSNSTLERGARGSPRTLDSMTRAKRTLVAVVVICAGLALWVANRPTVTSPFAHLAPPCQLAAWAAPLDFPELSAIRKKDRSEKMQYLGECNAKKITDVLWFVSGIHYNNWMKEDGRPPVRYEAIVYEDNDASDLHVQREGTQYSRCSVAAEGIDRTRIRYKRCGIGAYIFEFKKLHGL